MASESFRASFQAAREKTDELFRLISPAALLSRPVAERHRLIFYLGHFDAFDWNLLARRGMSAPAFHAGFDALFERGIDPAPGEAASDKPADWPAREEIDRYNATARRWIDSHFEDFDPSLLQMAIEHRLMHAETFAYLMHRLPYSEKSGGREKKLTPRAAPANPMINVNGGMATLGKTGEGFGWDNEHLAHQVAAQPFAVSRYKITNGEYLEFVREGGPAPHFWSREGNEWFYRGMFERYPLPLDHPAWVTWQQASAFARWRGLSLPSEAQFHIASEGSQPDASRDNFDFMNWDPVAVDAGAADRPAPHQMIGNGWEWTRDVFAPFAGFKPHPYYPGYSQDFFDGAHYVLKGASPRTARLLTRRSFRNWFRPEYPHMYAGFRLVEG